MNGQIYNQAIANDRQRGFSVRLKLKIGFNRKIELIDKNLFEGVDIILLINIVPFCSKQAKSEQKNM